MGVESPPGTPQPAEGLKVKTDGDAMPDEYDGMNAETDSYYYLPRFPLESGLVLPATRVAYRTWGTLSADADNCIFVPHALTANAAIDTWWGLLLGPGKAFDTDRFFVVGACMLGSPYGTTSPLDDVPEGVAWAAPREGTHAATALDRYAADFPYVTMRDVVRLHQMLLSQHLGVRSVHAVVGGSAGGMQALEWALLFPDYVQRIAALACGASQSAWQIAISEIQRQCIYRDADWNGGFYALGVPPAHGLSVARQHAMVWYRSPLAYQQKFGRRQQPATPGSPAAHAVNASGGGGRGAPDTYAVEGYLEHQGTKFVDRFDANCYVSLTRTLDSHDVGRDRGGVAAALRSIRMPVLIVGISSDVLYPLEQQRELAAHIPHAELEVVDSPQGHDAFLLEVETISASIKRALGMPAAADVAAVDVADSADATKGGGATKGGCPAVPEKVAWLMPTPAVLSCITAAAIAKRKAANAEARNAGCLSAVAW